MSKLLITTQVYENYAWNEDGTLGVGAEAYWKAKGGNDYVVRGVDACDMIEVIVDRARAQIECCNDAFQEFVIDYRIVEDDYLTEFERSQLEYEGRIAYPAREILVDEATV